MEKVYAKQGQSIQAAYKKSQRHDCKGIWELGNLCSFAEETSEVDFEIKNTRLAFWAQGVTLK